MPEKGFIRVPGRHGVRPRTVLAAGLSLAITALAAGAAVAQTQCAAGANAPAQCPQTQGPFGPVPPYFFNGFQSLDSRTLQQLANWSNAMLGLGTSNFLGQGDHYHTLGASAYDRSWKDDGGTLISNGISMSGNPTRTAAHGWELHDIYDAGRRLDLPDGQSLVIAGFANLSRSRTRDAGSPDVARENDFSLSLGAAYRNGDLYVIGALDGVQGHVRLNSLPGNGTARYTNKGLEGRVFVGRRIRLVDAATHGYALSADIGGYGAYLQGNSDAFTDSSRLAYGEGHAKSWLAGGKMTLEAEIPGKAFVWSPYAGLTFDRYFAPHISVQATPDVGAVTYIGRKALTGVEAGIGISDADNLTLDFKAYTQSNAQLRAVGGVLTLSHPF